VKAHTLVLAAAVAAWPLTASAQEPTVRWQRRGPAQTPVTVFHSTQSANLPTAETLRRGEMLIEISHRFQPAISEGADAFWGIDGPATNRLGIAYAPLDRLMVGILRSNLLDNLELNAKARVFEAGASSVVPIMVGVMGGVAFNTDVPASPGYDDDESQAYAQVILNVLLGHRLAVGVVPTYLHNPRIADATPDDAFVLGANGTLYLSPEVGLFGEWMGSEARPDFDDPAATLGDVATAGLQLEVGGHFFKLLVTNSTRLNPTQVLPGTRYSLGPSQWRFGFNLTRLMALGG